MHRCEYIVRAMVHMQMHAFGCMCVDAHVCAHVYKLGPVILYACERMRGVVRDKCDRASAHVYACDAVYARECIWMHV